MKSVAEPSASESKPEGETAAEAAERKEAERRRYKYRANKEDVEEELTDEEVALRLAKVRGSEKAFQERAELEKGIKDFFAELKKDPYSALKAIDIDLEPLSEKRLAEKYRKALEESQLSPEAREAKAAKEEAEKYRRQLEQIENTKREAARKEYVAKVESQTKATLEAALTELGVDATPEALADAARVMKTNLKNRLRLTPTQIASEVKRLHQDRLDRFHRTTAPRLKGEKLLQYFGGAESPVVAEFARALAESNSPVVNEIIKARLARMKKVEPFEPPTAKPVATPTTEKKERFDIAKWRRENILGMHSED